MNPIMWHPHCRNVKTLPRTPRNTKPLTRVSAFTPQLSELPLQFQACSSREAERDEDHAPALRPTLSRAPSLAPPTAGKKRQTAHTNRLTEESSKKPLLTATIFPSQGTDLRSDHRPFSFSLSLRCCI